MSWQEIEHIFNRSFRYSFSRKKLFFLLPLIVLCGVLITFFRVLALNAGGWIKLTLHFLPVFMCSSILLSAGIVLVRLYHHEVKQLSSSLRATIKQSRDLMVTVAYLSLPLVLLYLLLWTATGIFYLLKEIPAVGDFIGVLLSFGPFLLVLSFLVLSFINILLLFFLTPAVALRSQCNLEMVLGLLKTIQKNVFSHLILFFLGLLPALGTLGVLWVAAYVTESSYIQAQSAWGLLFQWLITMFPFCALITPACVFFFNFAAEAFALTQKKYSSV